MTEHRNCPSMPLKYWFSRSAGLTLEQKGALVDLLFAVWDEQPDTVDVREIASRMKIDTRVFKRLWTPDMKRAFDILRKTRKPIDRHQRTLIKERAGGRCSYCNVELSDDVCKPTSYHVDHKHPHALGGMTNDGNLVASCMACNLKKGKQYVQ